MAFPFNPAQLLAATTQPSTPVKSEDASTPSSLPDTMRYLAANGPLFQGLPGLPNGLPLPAGLPTGFSLPMGYPGVPIISKMPSDIKDQDFMYRLMIRQLVHDGLQEVALSLASSIGSSANLPAPSGPLFRLVAMALQVNEAEEQDDPEQEDEDEEEEESKVAAIQMPFKMRYLLTFPVERLSFYLKSEILQQLDTDDVIGLVKVNRGFQWMISNRPSVVFGRHVDMIRLFSQNEEEIIRIMKLRSNNIRSFEIILDVVRHFPLIQNIRSCTFLGFFSYRQLNKDYTFLKRLETVDQLGFCSESLDLSLDLSPKIEKHANFPSFVRKAPSLKDRVEHFIETRLNECEHVQFYCENDDDFQFYCCASRKSHIERVEFRFQSIIDKNLIVPTIRGIVSDGIPSKNRAASFFLNGFAKLTRDLKAAIVAFFKGYPGMKRILAKKCEPFIALAEGRFKGTFKEEALCFRQSINATRDCIYILAPVNYLTVFLAFYIKPEEMIDH